MEFLGFNLPQMPQMPQMEVFFDPLILATVNLMVIAGEMYIREHMQDKILTTQTALTERITILEGQIKKIAAIKPVIIDTSGTITLNTETGFFSRLFTLQDTDTTMSVYFEMAFVAIVGVLFYVLYVKDQENKLLSNMAVAQAREIGSLRLDLQKTDHTVATYKTQIDTHKKATQTTNALAAEYKKAGDEHKAAAAAAKSAADAASKAANDQAVDQVLAFNELVNLVKDKCVETDKLVAASKTDNEGVRKLIGELNEVLPRLQADAYQRGKDDCRSELLDEFGLKGMA
ncbi:hypothetical protein CkaCkLH20_12943 [Colletotrichum karsti]|uniref:Uncharacterized protein n=1 Tax=Colletotrichum karsti TaxID=1095194 RepID=A0A9P6LEH1_9PEZI|nr:uncharacterized protein CkaCkLH20_12943 [Colletotrichum karsti]KAF9869550.1 hypothetical protein CkaCkLH20_12943 [Colletotrichum karsti]